MHTAVTSNPQTNKHKDLDLPCGERKGEEERRREPEREKEPEKKRESDFVNSLVRRVLSFLLWVPPIKDRVRRPRVPPPPPLDRFDSASSALLLREHFGFVPYSCPSCAGFGAVCVKAASAAGACFGIQMCAVVFGNIQGTL